MMEELTSPMKQEKESGPVSVLLEFLNCYPLLYSLFSVVFPFSHQYLSQFISANNWILNVAIYKNLSQVTTQLPPQVAVRGFLLD